MKAYEVEKEIWRRLDYKHNVFSRMTGAGIEIGINKPEGGSLCSLLPIDDESRLRFVDFMVKEFNKKVLTDKK